MNASRGPSVFVPIFGIIVPVVCVCLFGLWIQPPDVLKHIANITAAVSPALTLFAIAAAAAGWYVQASRNGQEARKTEYAKQDHARQGTRRQVRTLLRAAITTIEPFSFLYTTLKLHDVTRTYQRFMDRLNASETAITLSDREYDVLDAFVAEFGIAIAVAQSEAKLKKPSLDFEEFDGFRTETEASKIELQRFLKTRRIRLLIGFRQTLDSLQAAVVQLGEPEMRRNIDEIKSRSEITRNALVEEIEGYLNNGL